MEQQQSWQIGINISTDVRNSRAMLEANGIALRQ